MSGKEQWDYESLRWIHRIREEHYAKTKGLPLEEWAGSVNPDEVLEACRRLGLKVRPHSGKKGKAGVAG